MEKRVPAYDLNTIKKVFFTANKLRITSTALKEARALGFSMNDIVDAIQQIKQQDFVKSMTTYANHRIWQDVYKTGYKGYFIYIKFQNDEMGYFVISFKEV